MSEAKDVLEAYIKLLQKRKIKYKYLGNCFSLTALDKNLKTYNLVTKQLTTNEYGRLVLAVRDEWLKVKNKYEL